MKAIQVSRFGGPEVLEYTDLPDPKPGAGQVSVRVHAAGINPVDVYMAAGKYGVRPLPYTPGFDAAGVVEAVGDGVSEFYMGDRVYVAGSVTGAYAELTVADQAHVHLLPDGISCAQGAALGVPYGTAYYGLFLRANAIAGETVLIHGASGGVGIAATQFALAAGLTIFGTAGTEKGRRLAAEQGVHNVLDHHAPGYLDEVKKLTGGHGVNLIIEFLANENLGKDLGVLAPKGRVVVIGSCGPVEIDPRITMGSDLSILGMSLSNAAPDELHRIHAAIRAGLENGTLDPIVGQEIPLTQAARGFEAIMSPGAYGKIVLVP